jgi:hypothetical protein
VKARDDLALKRIPWPTARSCPTITTWVDNGETVGRVYRIKADRDEL